MEFVSLHHQEDGYRRNPIFEDRPKIPKYKLSAETRAKMSASAKGRAARKRDEREESIQKDAKAREEERLSRRMKSYAERNPNLSKGGRPIGYRMEEDTRRKMSISARARYDRIDLVIELTASDYLMPPIDSPEYQRCHKAVRVRFGKASEYGCWFCDEDAFDWAWIHDTDPNDTESYIPLCRICHRRYDKAEWLKKEQAAKRASGIRKGWTPERRARASEMAKAQWASGNLNRVEQAERARRDRPWEGRRPKNGGGAR